MLKNRAQKTEKSQKLTPKWLHKNKFILRKSHWGAFGGPNRFCDEKVGPQRSQSAPKNEQLAKMTEK